MMNQMPMMDWFQYNTAPSPSPSPPANGYVAEDGTTYYVAEDGTTYYVQET